MKEIRRLERIFRKLGESLRLKILKIISAKPLCVGEIARRLNISPSLASHHLRLMEREGLVKREKEGKNVKYVLNKEELDNLVIRFYRFLDITMEVENIPKILRRQYGENLSDRDFSEGLN